MTTAFQTTGHYGQITSYLAQHKRAARHKLAVLGKVGFIKALRESTRADGLVHKDFLGVYPVITTVGIGLKEAKDLADLIDPSYGEA